MDVKRMQSIINGYRSLLLGLHRRNEDNKEIESALRLAQVFDPDIAGFTMKDIYRQAGWSESDEQ